MVYGITHTHIYVYIHIHIHNNQYTYIYKIFLVYMHLHILYTDHTSINPNKNFQVAVPSRTSHGIRARWVSWIEATLMDSGA
jgi:hypothetical protein